jgi:hypothetical protein
VTSLCGASCCGSTSTPKWLSTLLQHWQSDGEYNRQRIAVSKSQVIDVAVLPLVATSGTLRGQGSSFLPLLGGVKAPAEIT